MTLPKVSYSVAFCLTAMRQNPDWRWLDSIPESATMIASPGGPAELNCTLQASDADAHDDDENHLDEVTGNPVSASSIGRSPEVESCESSGAEADLFKEGCEEG